MALTFRGLDGWTYEIRPGTTPEHFEVWRGDDDMGSFVISSGVVSFRGWSTGKVDLATMNNLAQQFAEQVRARGATRRMTGGDGHEYDVRPSVQPNQYEVAADGAVIGSFVVADDGRVQFTGATNDVVADLVRRFAKTLAETAQ